MDNKLSELTRRLARECLASREAQPVYQCRFFTTDVDGKQIGEWQDMDKGFYDQYDPHCRRVLYTAPPAPAVPDDLIMQVRRLVHALKKSNPEHALVKQVPDYMRRAGYWKLTDCLRDHDACRAAILAAAPEGGN